MPGEGIGTILYKNQINSFISRRVTGHSLDRRTEKAYRLDLEHFYIWLEQKKGDIFSSDREQRDNLKVWMERYLGYLKVEKGLCASTICRKGRVLNYFLSYLAEEGKISGGGSLKLIQEQEAGESEPTVEKLPEEGSRDCRERAQEQKPPHETLSRKEADAFFDAMSREYEQLNSEFRRRVCLRDRIMMELLFYHKIEISELLRIEAPDYDQRTGMLIIRRKRGRHYTIRLFSQDLQRKLGIWLDEREHFRKEGEYWDRMFLSKLGKPLSMEMMIQIFDKYRKLAGIEKEFTPKDLKESSMKQYAKELVMERCS